MVTASARVTSEGPAPGTAGANDSADDGRGGSAGTSPARARAWPVVLLAFGAWFLGLLPWFLTQSTTGTFGTPWDPRNDLRDALLPFHHQRLPQLLVVVVVAGALAGLAPWWYRERSRHRVLMSVFASVGAGAATAFAVWQTVGPPADATRWLASLDVEQRGCIALTVGGSLLGLLLGLATSLGGPVVRTLAASVLIVVVSGWLGQCVVASGGASAPRWLPWALVVLTGTLTGVLLAVLGIRPRRRLLAWPAVGILVVLTTAALTASRYVLEGLRGTAVRPDAVAELVGDGFEVFRRSAAVTATALGAPSPIAAVLVAVLVGAVGVALIDSIGLRHHLTSQRAAVEGPEPPS